MQPDTASPEPPSRSSWRRPRSCCPHSWSWSTLSRMTQKQLEQTKNDFNNLFYFFYVAVENQFSSSVLSLHWPVEPCASADASASTHGSSPPSEHTPFGFIVNWNLFWGRSSFFRSNGVHPKRLGSRMLTANLEHGLRPFPHDCLHLKPLPLKLILQGQYELQANPMVVCEWNGIYWSQINSLGPNDIQHDWTPSANNVLSQWQCVISEKPFLKSVILTMWHTYLEILI